MPKRSNPFRDDVPLQSKIHVGVKEVNLGVNKDQNMKAVYERTQKLLFGVPQMQSNLSSKESFHTLQNTPKGSAQKSGVQDNWKNCCQINGAYNCSFCETRMCGECLRICIACKGDFCHLCSVMQYHMSREAALCLSCH